MNNGEQDTMIYFQFPAAFPNSTQKRRENRGEKKKQRQKKSTKKTPRRRIQENGDGGVLYCQAFVYSIQFELYPRFCICHTIPPALIICKLQALLIKF